MKRKRPITLGVLAILVIAYIISIVPNFRRSDERKRTVVALQSLSHDRVKTAAQAFARDRKIIESAVSLRELVSGGYLRAEDIRGLEDRDVSVSLAVDETLPQAILIRVRTSDGSDMVLLADGSIQRLPRQ